MNIHCTRCGTMNVNAQQPCPYCGLIRLVSAQTAKSQPVSSITSRPLARQTATEEPGNSMVPGTSLDREHYLLLDRESVQQWGPAFIETRWRAQEIEPGTGRQRYVTVVDVVLPTSTQRQSVSQMARRAFMGCDPPLLLNAFLERDHCFFVFANELGSTLQQRIDQFQLLREEEAMLCLRDVTRTLVGLSQLNPPVMHGWICPASLVQRGRHWQVLPGSVLAAGNAARFLVGTPAPLGIGQGSFDPGRDLFAAFQTVYAGLTGVMPQPVRTQGLPPVAPSVSASFSSLLARGLQAGFRNAGELWAIIGEAPARRSPPRNSSISGNLTTSGAILRAPALEVPRPAASVFVAREMPSGDTAKEDAGQLPRPSEMPAYPSAHDGRLALYWGAGILAAEAVLLAFSH